MNSNSEQSNSSRKRLFAATTPKNAGKENKGTHLVPKSSESKRTKVSEKDHVSPHTNLSENIQNSIVNFGRKIKLVGEEEVDLDDPNSAFVRCEKMKSRLIRFASKCYEEKDIKPMYQVYKKIKLKSTSVPFPDMIQAVEKFVNASCIQYGGRNIPCASDVKAVIEKWSSSNNVLTAEDVNKYAEKIMKLIVNDIRKKRRKDLDAVLNKYIEVENRDPAEIDPLLAEKLVRNEQSKINMESLERSFVNGEEVRCNQFQRSITASKIEEPEIKTEPM